MEPTLLAITLAALLMAAAMSILAWRMVAEERRRSEARVAALAAAIGAGSTDPPVPAASDAASPGAPPGPAQRARPGAAAATPAREPDATSRVIDHPASPHARRAAAATSLPVETPEAPVVADLFGASAGRQRGSHRLIPAVAAVALLVSLLGAAAIVLQSRAAPGASGPQLELLSLRHAASEGTLQITGLVRNPVHGVPMRRLAAVAFLYDRGGEFLASGRAPLDFTTLAPGEESPFVITIAAPPSTSRYRVSFRDEAEGAIPHVDRRKDDGPGA